MFSQTVEYALRAVVFLAQHPGEARATDTVAEATRVPAAYLAKILQGLVRAGILRSQRGVGGGVTLARTPGTIRILDVINAVEPIKRITTCPLGIAAHGVNLCPLHRQLDDALAMVQQTFANTCLSQVLNDPSPSVPLCDFPPNLELRPRKKAAEG